MFTLSLLSLCRSTERPLEEIYFFRLDEVR